MDKNEEEKIIKALDTPEGRRMLADIINPAIEIAFENIINKIDGDIYGYGTDWWKIGMTNPSERQL